MLQAARQKEQVCQYKQQLEEALAEATYHITCSVLGIACQSQRIQLSVALAEASHHPFAHAYAMHMQAHTRARIWVHMDAYMHGRKRTRMHAEAG